MNIRIFKLSINEIITDPVSAGRAVDNSVRRGNVMKVRGCCDIGGEVLIVLEKCAERTNCTYVFSKLADSSDDGVSAEIVSRYSAGLTLISSFRVGDDVWGFFENVPPSAQ